MMAEAANEFASLLAKRDGHTPLMVAVTGPSGSGKTESSLRLATGMASIAGGIPHLIDTEAKRSTHYASKYKFNRCDFRPPFTAARYLAAIQQQVKEGARVVIVDSASHEHAGVGGYLEGHAKEMERLGNDPKNNFTAWAKPARERRALIDGLLQLEGVHFIFCFRAKEKLEIRPGRPPIARGWEPIAGEEFIFEMATQLVFPPGSKGRPMLVGTRPGEIEAIKIPGYFDGVFKQGEQICERHGELLARWAMGEEISSPTGPSQRPPPAEKEAGGPPPPPPPASDFPGDKKGGPAHAFTILEPGADGEPTSRGTNDPEKWAKYFESALAQPDANFETPDAAAEWKRELIRLNDDFIALKNDTGHEAFAQRIYAAWRKCGLDGGEL